MAKPEKTPALAPADAETLTAEQAAAAVGIDPAEAFAYRDYGTHVVVVTIAGQKLDSRMQTHDGAA